MMFCDFFPPLVTCYLTLMALFQRMIVIFPPSAGENSKLVLHHFSLLCPNSTVLSTQHPPAASPSQPAVGFSAILFCTTNSNPHIRTFQSTYLKGDCLGQSRTCGHCYKIPPPWILRGSCKPSSFPFPTWLPKCTKVTIWILYDSAVRVKTGSLYLYVPSEGEALALDKTYRRGGSSDSAFPNMNRCS